MIYKTDGEIELLIERFENCSVTAKEWTHAAHLTAALWYCLREPDLETATAKMRDGIFKLNAAHGTPNTPTRGYHETLTVFWMRTVSDFLGNIKDRGSLALLANEVIETCGDSGLPLKFYSRELLFSPEARAKYIEPDLAK
jgi:hypothetical protein